MNERDTPVFNEGPHANADNPSGASSLNEAQSTEPDLGNEESLLPGEDLSQEAGLEAGASDVSEASESTTTAGAEPSGPIFSEAALRDPGIQDSSTASPRTLQAEDLPEDKQMLELFVTEERLTALWDRITAAQQAVNAQVDSLKIARDLLDLIKSARNELLAGADHYEESERHLSEVEYRILHSGRSFRWAYTYGIGLFFYEVLMAGLILWLYLNFRVEPTQATGSTVGLLNSEYLFFFVSILSGGLGGVIGALFSLVKHIAQDQDFDRQHSVWYLGSPLMGAGIGAVVFIILRAGLLSLTGPQGIETPYVIYLLSFLSGYQHNVFTDMLRRVLKVFEGEKPAAN